MNIKQWIADWAKENNYTSEEDFWDFFYDMKPDVELLCVHKIICIKNIDPCEEEEFDDWYDNEFFEIAKPIMMELFGYTEEDIEYV